MQDFRKRGKNSITANLFILGGASLVVLAFAVFTAKASWEMYVKFTVASRGDDASKLELAQLQDQYQKVSAAVADLSTTRGEESQIRERFGVGKPGEGTIEIVRNGTSSEDTQGSSAENPFMRIWHALFIW